MSCWYTQVGTLYRCRPDGTGITCLSANIEHDNTPAVMPDGRLLYMRWEYIDRSQVEYHALWTMNPDGTGDSTMLGPQSPQALVTKGSWMGARTHGEWTLFSCWCAPAFEPEHFELGERSALLGAYPGHAAEITALTRTHPIGQMR